MHSNRKRELYINSQKGCPPRDPHSPLTTRNTTPSLVVESSPSVASSTRHQRHAPHRPVPTLGQSLEDTCLEICPRVGAKLVAAAIPRLEAAVARVYSTPRCWKAMCRCRSSSVAVAAGRTSCESEQPRRPRNRR